jgi:hypothetical protein
VALLTTEGEVLSVYASGAQQDVLNREVAAYVAKGYAVESTTPGQAIVSKRARIGWFWNIILSLLTGGLWLIVVVYQLINRKTDRVVLTVTEDGRVLRR